MTPKSSEGRPCQLRPQCKTVLKEFICSIVWDNLNIAFCIAEQCLDSKSHFDSGTTLTLVVGYNPYTRDKLAHGTLPLSMKPPCISTKQLISDPDSLLLISAADTITLEWCSLWQLKSLALQYLPELKDLRSDLELCPSVNQIEPHVTEQYPLPAMYIDESGLDGTSEHLENDLKP